MTVEDLEHGSYYTFRGSEHNVVVAYFDNGSWFLVDSEIESYHRLMVQGNALVIAAPDGHVVSPSVFTLADLMPDSMEAAIDAVARNLLADVDI